MLQTPFKTPTELLVTPARSGTIMVQTNRPTRPPRHYAKAQRRFEAHIVAASGKTRDFPS
ncbi:MAG: hypothetical protein WCK33_03395 [Phycisphaerae bacterium]